MNGLLLTAANTTTTTGLQNASSSLNEGFASAGGLVSVSIVVLTAAVTLIFIGTHVQRIEWLHQKLKAFSHSLYYTLVGLGFTAVLAVVAAPVYYLAQMDGQTQTRVGYVLGGLVAAYVVFTGLGWVVDRTLMANVREYMAQLEGEDDG